MAMEDSFEKRWQQNMNIPQMLLSLGEDLEREGLEETPERVRRSWEELLKGYTLDPEEVMKRTFEVEGEGLQLCRNIEFTSICEHHMIPFFGVVHIGYIPNERLSGLSKLSRLVDCFSQRLQIQERMTQQIADALNDFLEPKGVLVIARARHLCCLGRGIKRTKMEFVTSAQHGAVDPSLYALLLGDE